MMFILEQQYRTERKEVLRLLAVFYKFLKHSCYLILDNVLDRFVEITANIFILAYFCGLHVEIFWMVE